MIDLIKKTLYAGIGATAVTKEQLEKTLNKLVEQGKMTKDEASKMADEVMTDGKKEFEKSTKELHAIYDDWMKKTGLVTETEFKKLAARVAKLEKELAETSAPKKTATKKAAAKS